MPGGFLLPFQSLRRAKPLPNDHEEGLRLWIEVRVSIASSRQASSQPI